MRKIIITQIILNIVFVIFTIPFIAGKMLGIKYNFDDPSSTSKSIDCSNTLYEFINHFSLLIGLIITINIVLSILILKKSK